MLLGWFFLIFDTLFLPYLSYHLLIYYKHRNHSYFRPRQSKTTIWFVSLSIIIMISRMFDGMIGMGYLPLAWLLSDFFAFFQLIILLFI